MGCSETGKSGPITIALVQLVGISYEKTARLWKHVAGW